MHGRAEYRQSRASEPSDAIQNTTPLDRLNATHRVERDLERVYFDLTGEPSLRQR